jgi:hypothetical protein
MLEGLDLLEGLDMLDHLDLLERLDPNQTLWAYPFLNTLKIQLFM